MAQWDEETFFKMDLYFKPCCFEKVYPFVYMVFDDGLKASLLVTFDLRTLIFLGISCINMTQQIKELL
jgi:hypothetical protein